MPLFGKKMARETPKDSSAAAAASSDKPLPDPSTQRPGTSGTEALLVTNRRQASARFQAAQKAERTYKAKKRSASARVNFGEAKAHFKQAGSHLRRGVSLTWSVVRSAPYFVGEKLDGRREKAAESKKLRALEKRKKLEQQLAKENAQRESSEAGNEAAEPAAETTA